MFLVTEAGQLGRSGMNFFGIDVTANSLMSSIEFVPSKYQEMVLECSHLAEALTAVYNFPRHVSNNLTIATVENFGLCLKITPGRVYKVYSNTSDKYLVHTNHFVHPGFLSRSDIRDCYPGGSSWYRKHRFEQGIRSRTVRGEVNQEKSVQAFSDHLDYPEALCCHPDASPGMVIGDFPAIRSEAQVQLSHVCFTT